MAAELLIQNGSTVFAPVVEEGIEWTTERSGSPGKLTFKVRQDNILNIAEGNAVRFRWNGNNIFFGYIFNKKKDKEGVWTITAYDQLRYLKNKETYVYENMTASEVVQMICSDFGMQTGVIEYTDYKIASRVEDSQTLIDIIQNALDITLTNMKYMYVMYDDFGKITLKGVDNLALNLMIDHETGQNYEYTSSIDEQTYNRIKLIFDNEETGKRDVYIAQDSNSIDEWGILQFYESLQKGENGQAKADALLDLYNHKTRKLSMKEVFGDVRVRAGSSLVVVLDLVDVKVEQYMLVETCTHVFRLNEHVMNLNLKGGEFVA